MNDRILVRLDYDRGFIGLRTFTRRHGRSMRFLFSEELIARVLYESVGTVYDCDCGNYAAIRNEGGIVTVRLSWLHSCNQDGLAGYEQIVRIPTHELDKVLNDYVPVRLLSQESSPWATIDASHAASTIRHLRLDRQKIRAFSKAMRDCFQWRDEHITLMSDGNDSFYFTTSSGCPICGGLILHHAERGGFPYVYYSVHT